ncbi:hypothetical protein BH11CYA1_BH11CYA1_37970 [soil metagenome]
MPILRHHDISQEPAVKPNAVEQPTSETVVDESLAGKLNREFGLLAQLPMGALAAAQERLNHPVDLAIELGVATAVGFGVMAMAKNPAVFGEAASPYVGGLLKWVDKLSGPAIAIDWANRIGAPMASTWMSASNDSSARADMSRNVGGGLVDYSTGVLGMRFGGRMAEYIEAPAQAAAKIDVQKILDANRRVQTLGEEPVLAHQSLKAVDYAKIMRERTFDLVRIRTFSSGVTGESLTNYYQSKGGNLSSDLSSFLTRDSQLHLDSVK